MTPQEDVKLIVGTAGEPARRLFSLAIVWLGKRSNITERYREPSGHLAAQAAAFEQVSTELTQAVRLVYPAWELSTTEPGFTTSGRPDIDAILTDGTRSPADRLAGLAVLWRGRAQDETGEHSGASDVYQAARLELLEALDIVYPQDGQA